jgi:NAD(P)-dependent dehydrogenase (short-subunit alcohol dehydrogenase family)
MDILHGKLAIVTGAGSGIGRAVALKFASEGAKVVVADINKSGEETVENIKNNGGEALFLQTDVSRSEDIKNMISTTVAKYGRLDILVNAAAIVANEISTIDCTEDIFHRVIAVNLTGTWLAMKYAMPPLIKNRGGAIINFTSIAALEAYKSIPAYAASKGGVISLSRVAAIENASKNIRINCIAPGHIATPMFLGCWSREQLNHLEEMAPIGRFGKPEEIAEVVLFLASDASSHITATTLVADGGITARIP